MCDLKKVMRYYSYMMRGRPQYENSEQRETERIIPITEEINIRLDEAKCPYVAINRNFRKTKQRSFGYLQAIFYTKLQAT